MTVAPSQFLQAQAFGPTWPRHGDWDATAPASGARSLEGISDRLASCTLLGGEFHNRFLSAATERIGVPMRMRLAGICQMSLGQFRQRVEEPTCCYRLILHPARRTDTQAPAGRQTESIWLEFTPALAGTMVNCLLGDNSTEALSSRRSVTPVERRLLRQIVQQLADALAATWTAPPPRAASVAEDYGLTGADGDCGLEQSLAVLSFSVSLPGQVGTIRLAMSETLLESMLNRQVPAGGPKKSLEVSASLAEMLVPSDELTALAPGDILMTDAPAEGQAVVRLAGIAKFAGSLGCWGGRRAVSVKGRFSAGQARCNAPAESSSTVPPNRHRR